ncbi:WxL domain-containing protein [Lactobacillus sp. CC-MHH1034]|uniref:WxL domain-containing protein n=1 Tax=Agrilactobacillus fermenti TaxID=2586909 RepID=UPI001E2E49B4|nr:WxL domain-containing protein [Agrilactobacillus fermenti]MCD2256534.1 WxL domain-containing protein [Agrilactobacillus fermenti]
MNKRRLGTVLVTTLAAVGAVSVIDTGQAMAAPADQTATSRAGVEFTDVPQEDALKILAVPDMHFGSHEINNDTATTATAVDSGTGHTTPGSTITTGHTISVQDRRSAATATGWTLNAKTSSPFALEDNSATINGATITLQNGTTTPTTGVTFGDGSSVTLNDNDAPVLTGSNAAIGTVTTSLTNNDMTLSIPARAVTKAGVYEAAVTWNLQAVPTL